MRVLIMCYACRLLPKQTIWHMIMESTSPKTPLFLCGDLLKFHFNQIGPIVGLIMCKTSN